MDEAARLRIIIQALGVREAQRSLRSLDGDLNRSARTARRAGGQIEQSAARSASALTRMGRAAALGGTAALAVGFGAAVKAGFKFNAQMESNELAMRRFIGSTSKTRAYLKDLADLAERSPFEFTQLTQGARRMMAFGVSANQTKKTLTAVADAIAAAGGGAERIDQVTLALGQMATKGRVSGEELLQLNEAGIPATKILKRELGLTGEQVGKIGTLGIKSGDAITALTQGMTRDFGGASREQAKTWDGLMSTLRDKWSRTSGSMTKGLFREAKKWAPRIGETLDDIGRIFRRRDLSFGDKIKLSTASVRRNILDPVRRAVGRMHLGDKLSKAFEDAAPRVLDAMGEIAGKSAGVFVRAFKDAGPWGKLVTVAFLASKLGAFRAAGSVAAGMFARRFRRSGAITGAAAAQGTRSGAAYSSTFAATSSAGIAGAARGGRFAGAAAAIGRAMGPIAGALIAAEVVHAMDEAARNWGDPNGNSKGRVGTQSISGGTVAGARAGADFGTKVGLAIGTIRRTGPVGEGGAGLSPRGSGLGGFQKRWNNPNEGGAQMHPARDGRRGKPAKETLAHRLKLRNAANKRIADRVDTVDFQLEMGKITAGAAADQLEALAAGVKHNKALRRQILVSAHNLRQQISEDARQQTEDARTEARERRRQAAAHEASERRRMQADRRTTLASRNRALRAAKARQRRRDRSSSGDFELNVGDVRIPTVYEVRRTNLEHGRAVSPVGLAQHQGTIVHGGVHITIDGAHSPRETAQAVVDQIDRTRRTHGAAARRARGKKRGQR